MEKITNNEEETVNFAAEYAKNLKGGEILALIGELGAGKTVFTKGLAKGLGVNQRLSSPTFVYMKLYEIRNQDKLKKLCHVDAYRAQHEYDLINIGAEDFMGKEDTITVIEWADRIRNILPKRTQYIYFENQGENKRLIKDNTEEKK
jgi:tRNA threonylcarbamoyladenosine biosynthesis protein TsaE